MTKIDAILILVSIRLALDAFIMIRWLIARATERKLEENQRESYKPCKMCLTPTPFFCMYCKETVCGPLCAVEHQKQSKCNKLPTCEVCGSVELHSTMPDLCKVCYDIKMNAIMKAK